jgi:redox-sensitive bicupin YhaK (pirin superfamily)
VQHEEGPPDFVHYDIAQLPAVEEDRLRGRLIAGDAYGQSSPVRTLSPLFYAHLELETGASATLPSNYSERAAYIVSGKLAIEGREHAPNRLLVFERSARPSLTAAEPSVVMVLGGEPLGERHIWWNFVSSRMDRIDKAKADWAAGRFALPPSDKDEFIPLPEESPSPPEPMS